MAEEKTQMKPPPEFLAACRKVLGDDSPATVIGLMRSGDWHTINEVYAQAARDPKKWFCAASDEGGIPRLWAKGDTEAEARKSAELAVTRFRESKQGHRHMVPRGDWIFDTYAPQS